MCLTDASSGKYGFSAHGLQPLSEKRVARRGSTAACGKMLAVKILQILLLMPLLFAGVASASDTVVVLNEAERAYLARLGPVRLCVDPDWFPFERISADGRHEGIAADLIELVARRSGVAIHLLPTKTWEESLDASRNGECQLMSFLNQTPERDRWLLFTQPIFIDPNVIIVRADQPDIPNLGALEKKSVALPAGTMVKERLEGEYPGLRVIPTISEEEAIHLVASGVADMTIRSQIMTAYTIRKEGLFNLKIAGRLPGYDNALRIGVIRGESMLRDILEKGVATLTQADRDAVANRHAALQVVNRVDFRLMWEVLGGALLLIVVLIHRHRQQRRLDAAHIALSEQRAVDERRAREEQGRLVAMLSHEVKTPLAMIDGAVQTLRHLVDTGTPEVERRLDRIRRGVKRLENLSECFLDKDRLDNAYLRLNLLPTDLARLAKDVVVELDAAERVIVNAPAPVVAAVDHGLIGIAIRNLLINAMNYAPADRPITLSVEAWAESACIRVRDHGPGIPPELRSELFTCYVRGRHGADIPGAGLGLYLVRRVAELHGGRIALGDTTDGAEFNLLLPSNPTGCP